MGRAMLMLMLGSLLLVQSACSIAWALKQPPPKDIEGLGIGSPRDHVIGRLGIPKLQKPTLKDANRTCSSFSQECISYQNFG
jgi:hypothetical protein